MLLLISTTFAQGQLIEQPHRNTIDFDSIIQADAFSKEHAEMFGSLIIQDAGGRMKPANTFSSELLRKVSKSDTYNGLPLLQLLQ